MHQRRSVRGLWGVAPFMADIDVQRSAGPVDGVGHLVFFFPAWGHLPGVGANGEGRPFVRDEWQECCQGRCTRESSAILLLLGSIETRSGAVYLKTWRALPIRFFVEWRRVRPFVTTRLPNQVPLRQGVTSSPLTTPGRLRPPWPMQVGEGSANEQTVRGDIPESSNRRRTGPTPDVAGGAGPGKQLAAADSRAGVRVPGLTKGRGPTRDGGSKREIRAVHEAAPGRSAILLPTTTDGNILAPRHVRPFRPLSRPMPMFAGYADGVGGDAPDRVRREQLQRDARQRAANGAGFRELLAEGPGSRLGPFDTHSAHRQGRSLIEAGAVHERSRRRDFRSRHAVQRLHSAKPAFVGPTVSEQQLRSPWHGSGAALCPVCNDR